MSKVATDVGKPCNRIVTNYCYNIVQNYLGYITGIDVAYSSCDDFDAVQDILNYNDVRTEDSEYLRNALIFGRAFEINYVDEDAIQRFKVLDSRECIPIYSNDLNNDLLYVIRYYVADTVNNDQDEYYIEVYGNKFIRKYKSSNAFATLSLLEEQPNYYNQVPVTVFSLNADEESVFDKVMTLQDAYNKLLSSEVDDFESFCDAYLVLKGCMADDGVYHYNYVYNRKRTITITLPTTTQEVVAAVLNAVAGKTYNLTYYDAIDGEKTIQAHTKSTNSTLFSGVLLNGLWNGVSFKAEEIGGEMA